MDECASEALHPGEGGDGRAVRPGQRGRPDHEVHGSMAMGAWPAQEPRYAKKRGARAPRGDRSTGSTRATVPHGAHARISNWCQRLTGAAGERLFTFLVACVGPDLPSVNDCWYGLTQYGKPAGVACSHLPLVPTSY